MTPEEEPNLYPPPTLDFQLVIHDRGGGGGLFLEYDPLQEQRVYTIFKWCESKLRPL